MELPKIIETVFLFDLKNKALPPASAWTVRNTFSACFQMICLICSLNCTAQTKTATGVFYLLSVQVGPLTRPDLDYGTVTTYITTFDGRTDVYPLNQNLGGGLTAFSQELRPKAGVAGVYEADYIENISDGYLEYGSLTITLPSPDADQNGIPDLVQLDRGVNTDFTGTMQSDMPKVVARALKGHLFRAANSSSGTIFYSAGARGQTNYGTFFVPNSSAIVSYSRGPTNIVNLAFSSTNNTGVIWTTNVTTTFSVKNADQIALPELVVYRPDNTRVTQHASTMTRFGKKYIGTFEADDGLPQTSWRDLVYRVWQFTDDNDTDGNGVPDLSDTLPVVSGVKFATITKLQNKQIRLNVAGPTGRDLTIYTSSNLRDWLPLISLPSQSGTLEFTDPSAGSLSQRFYRATSP